MTYVETSLGPRAGLATAVLVAVGYTVAIAGVFTMSGGMVAMTVAHYTSQLVSPTGLRPAGASAQRRFAGSGCLRCEPPATSYFAVRHRVHSGRAAPAAGNLAHIWPVQTPGVMSTLDLMVGAIRRSPLASFVGLAYAVSWAWMFPFVAAGDVVRKGVGWPTHFPALLGPAVAAFVVTALVWGRAGVRDLLARMARWRMPLRWWAATLSPVAFLGVALAVALAAGKLPRGSDFGRYSGLSAIGVLPVWVMRS